MQNHPFLATIFPHQTQPVTPRSLETLIRLSTAHAKCRMSKTVDLEDAEAAIELIQFAIFKKVLAKDKKKKKRDESSDEEQEQEEAVEEEGASQTQKRKRWERDKIQDV